MSCFYSCSCLTIFQNYFKGQAQARNFSDQMNTKEEFTVLHHHHRHVPEGLGVFPVPWSSKWSSSLHLFFGRPMFLRPFGLYCTCSACFGILFASILCTCCSHFFWYCFISSTMFCAHVFSLMHWFFSLSNFIIPSKCLKNFICAASKRCSTLFFSTQASLPNFNAALAVMLWILKNTIHIK